jgi:hypothetical protein
MRPFACLLIAGLSGLVLAPVSAVSGDPVLLAQAAKPGAAVKAIATADGEAPDTRAEILELKRTSGNQLMLRFMIVNDSGKSFQFLERMTDPANSSKDYGSISGVHILDETNKKKHFVLRDAEGNCVCSRKLDDVAAKGRLTVWARFPAPPEATQKVSVVIPHFVPADDVPIAR